MRRREALLALLAATAALSGTPYRRALAAAGTAPPKQVVIDNFTFSPPALTVPVGTTVTWLNRDDIPHVVVDSATPPAFRSRALDTDERFSFDFKRAGTYRYFCALHPMMQGTVTVR